MVGFIHEIGTYYIALLFRTRAFGRYLSIPHKTQTGHHKDNRRLLSKAILLPPCNTGLQLSLLGLVRAFQRLVMHRSIVVSGKVKSSWCCRGLEIRTSRHTLPEFAAWDLLVWQALKQDLVPTQTPKAKTIPTAFLFSGLRRRWQFHPWRLPYHDHTPQRHRSKHTVMQCIHGLPAFPTCAQNHRGCTIRYYTIL